MPFTFKASDFFSPALICFVLVTLFSGCLSAPQVETNFETTRKANYDQSSNLARYREKKRIAYDNQMGLRGKKDRVFWLGVCVNVRQDELPETMPYFDKAGLAGLINNQALDSLRKAKPAYFDIINVDLSQGAESRRHGDLGMAILINQEISHTDQLDDGSWRTDYRLIGQLVFIDLDEYIITASFPIGLQYTGQLSSRPQEEDWIGQAKASIVNDETKKLNINAQFAELLASDIFAARACFAPLALDPIELATSCTNPRTAGLVNPIQLDRQKLELRATQWATLFCNFLGAGTDREISPYVAARNHDSGNRLSLCFPDSAYLSTVSVRGNTIKVGMTIPSLRLKLVINELTCENDPEMSGKYVVSLIYGFRGSIQAIDPIDNSLVFETPIRLSLGDIMAARPKNLSNRYWNMTRRKLSPAQFNSESIDHYEGWAKSMEHILEQLKNEMFFPESDESSRFNSLRADTRFR